jgi:mono/diheme cytochrome c family protein
VNKIIAFAVVVVIAGIGAYVLQGTDEPVPQVSDGHAAALVDVTLPTSLSDNATIGLLAFDANCAQCHGANAAGQDGIAPPLVHIIYEPSHHADESFQRAVALGVRAHHWPFGDMAPVAGLNRSDVAMIATYVRELQRANGIN